MPDYDRLGAFDRCFLDIEDGNAHMHIGAVMVFDAGPVLGSNGSVDVGRIRRFVGGRLARVPRYRQRLARIPIENHPVWVDDDRFDLDYHIRHISVAKPGDARQLKGLVAWLNSQPLDRARPLWEMWVIEGLSDNGFAIFQKVHHCMVDGVAGAEEMAVVLAASPDEGPEITCHWQPRAMPTSTRLVYDAMLRRTTAPLLVARTFLRALCTDPRKTMKSVAQTAEGLASIVTRVMSPVSGTRLNGEIGAQRRFDWMPTALSLIKQIRTRLGGTLNDVVLATVAGALRRYFLQKGSSEEDLAGMTVRAMCPVNRRGTEDAATAGNKIAAMFVELPVGVACAHQRLSRVRLETARAKQAHHADAVEAVAGLTEWTTPALLNAIARAGSRNRTFNLVITNVPGPQLPLYLLGAPLRQAVPVVPIFEYQGLTIALFSYAGTIFWGFNADREIVPDLSEFVAGIEDSLTELAHAAGAISDERLPIEREAVGAKVNGSRVAAARPTEPTSAAALNLARVSS